MQSAAHQRPNSATRSVQLKHFSRSCFLHISPPNRTSVLALTRSCIFLLIACLSPPLHLRETRCCDTRSPAERHVTTFDRGVDRHCSRLPAGRRHAERSTSIDLARSVGVRCALRAPRTSARMDQARSAPIGCGATERALHLAAVTMSVARSNKESAATEATLEPSHGTTQAYLLEDRSHAGSITRVPPQEWPLFAGSTRISSVLIAMLRLSPGTGWRPNGKRSCMVNCSPVTSTTSRVAPP